jgi:hypothetical protein
MAIIPPDPPGGKPPDSNDDLLAILKQLPPDDPRRKLLLAPFLAGRAAIAQLESDEAAGVPPDPKRASDLVLSQFSVYASTAIQTVRDLESAIEGEREWAAVIDGLMGWFVQYLLKCCPHDEENGKRCSELNRKLVKVSRDATVTMWDSIGKQSSAPAEREAESPPPSPSPTDGEPNTPVQAPFTRKRAPTGRPPKELIDRIVAIAREMNPPPHGARDLAEAAAPNIEGQAYEKLKGGAHGDKKRFLNQCRYAFTVFKLTKA